jgi:hypothetical protein
MKKILLASTLLAASFSVSAATTSFNFNGNTLPTGSISFTSADNNLSLTATADNQLSSNGQIQLENNRFVGQYSGGLGVCHGTPNANAYGGCSGENHQVDGNYGNDVVLFDFGTQEVTLESVTLSYIGSNDEFSFSFFDGISTTPTNFFSSLNTPSNGISTYIFSQVWTGSLFGIGAVDYNDEFKISGIGVSYDVAAVPVPAAAFLFAPALLGFMGLRRKTKVA